MDFNEESVVIVPEMYRNMGRNLSAWVEAEFTLFTPVTTAIAMINVTGKNKNFSKTLL